MENPVFNYLNENKGKKLSATTIGKRLNINRKATYYFILSNPYIRRVSPLEVGSLAYNSRVFTIDLDE